MAPKDVPAGMFPELPPDLTALADEELTVLRDDYLAIVKLATDKDEETLGERTAEQIRTELTAGVEALEAIQAEQAARAEAEENFNNELAALKTRAGVTDEAEGDESDEENGEGDAGDGDEEPEASAEEPAVVPALEPVAASARAVRRPPPAGRRHRPQTNAEPEGTPLLASSFVHPFAEPGENLDSERLAAISCDLINKNRITPGMKVIVASATFQFPEERMLDRDGARNSTKINTITGPKALVASGGLCAPLTPIYTIPSVETADRPVRDALAGFRAERGGVIVPENPVITDYADAVGIVTAEDDELGGTLAVKTCMRIECPQFNSVEVDSIYRCLEVGNLTGKAYPELLARVDTLVMANHARLAETHLLTKIKAGSTAVTGINTANAGAVWEFLGHVIVATAGARSRNRMSANATFRALLPEWILDLLQLDITRGQFDRGGARAQAEAFLRGAGINPTFYKDGPTTGTGQVFGAQTAGNLVVFPTDVQWALYPEGSWLHLDSGSLDLGIVRDSTLNSTNDYQIFAETWEMVAFIGVESLWITSTICPNGTVSAPKDLSAVCTA